MHINLLQIHVHVYRKCAGVYREYTVHYISPSVVFRVEEEVGADDSDTHSDHYHDEEDQQHEPKHVVYLVLPE